MDPLDYSVLVMLSAVYPLWGKTRLRHLEPWISEWALDELYAGVGGQDRSCAHTTKRIP